MKGETPGGEKYRAMDPVLLDWVAATASYGFLTAYDRFVHPLSDSDKNRFMRDSEEIGRDFAAELERWFPGHADYLDSALAAVRCKRQFGGKPGGRHARKAHV